MGLFLEFMRSLTSKITIVLDSLTIVWNCIIFIRKGFFKDGKFKFDLIFPPAFPHACPTIEFKTSVYHPLIKEFEGILDMDQLINQ